MSRPKSVRSLATTTHVMNDQTTQAFEEKGISAKLLGGEILYGFAIMVMRPSSVVTNICNATRVIAVTSIVEHSRENSKNRWLSRPTL